MGSSASSPSAGQAQAKSNRPCLMQYPPPTTKGSLHPQGPQGPCAHLPCCPGSCWGSLPPYSGFPEDQDPVGTGWPHQWTESRQRQRVVGRQAGRQRPALSRARLGLPFDPGASEHGFGPCCGPVPPAEGASSQLPPQACPTGEVSSLRAHRNHL